MALSNPNASPRHNSWAVLNWDPPSSPRPTITTSLKGPQSGPDHTRRGEDRLFVWVHRNPHSILTTVPILQYLQIRLYAVLGGTATRVNPVRPKNQTQSPLILTGRASEVQNVHDSALLVFSVFQTIWLVCYFVYFFVFLS